MYVVKVYVNRLRYLDFVIVTITFVFLKKIIVNIKFLIKLLEIAIIFNN